MPDLNQIFLYADIEKRQLITSDGLPMAGEDLLALYREEIVILCITCLQSDLTAAEFAANNTFELGTAQDFDQTTNVLTLAENDDFNIDGDWAAASLTGGKLSVRVNTNTPEFIAFLGVSGQKDANIYLRMFGSSSAATLFDHPCTLHNIRRASSAVPAGITSPTYRTAAAQDIIDATKADKISAVDIEITDATKGLILPDGEGNRRRITLDNFGRLNVSGALT